MPPHPIIDIGAFARSGRLHPTRALVRVTLGAMLVSGVMAVPQAATPEPVAAASCTGWTSKATPPTTIKVLRTGSGKVAEVSFRRYVAEVMASGEWPSHLKKASLEVGAVVTKQYAWFYAMKGNHRSGYSRGGRCFDVRDDYLDQIYRPEKAEPTAKQQAAIDATWGLTLRKNGRFFLTGYRQGSASNCGTDANGWKIYAKSMGDCARNGWSSTRILKRYLNPNLKLVWSNTLGPAVAKPRIALRPGNTIPSGAATLFWRPANNKADVSSFTVQRKIGKGSWKTVAEPGSGGRQRDVWLKTGTNNRFRVHAKDDKERRGPWAYSPKRKATIRGPVGLSLAGEGVDPAASEPVKAKTRFTGRSIAFVTRTGPGMGRAKVFVDGRKIAVIDLERETTTTRALVWAKNWTTAKPRSVSVKAVDPTVRVDFDGFFILR